MISISRLYLSLASCHFFPHLRLGNSKDYVNVFVVNLGYLLWGTAQLWIRDEDKVPGHFLSSCSGWALCSHKGAF